MEITFRVHGSPLLNDVGCVLCGSAYSGFGGDLLLFKDGEFIGSVCPDCSMDDPEAIAKRIRDDTAEWIADTKKELVEYPERRAIFADQIAAIDPEVWRKLACERLRKQKQTEAARTRALGGDEAQA